MKKIIIIILISTQVTLAQNLNDLSFGTESNLDVISWNIEWFPKNNLTANYVETILTSLDADIYALQEIDDTSLLKQVVSNISGYECHFKSSYYGGLAYVYNTNTVTINSKYEIYTSQPYWSSFPRKPQVLDLDFNGENYIVINNHFKCCGDGYLNTNDTNDEENRRLNAVNYLKEYIDNTLNNKNVIVVGDLNDQLTDIESNNIFQELINDSMRYLFTDLQIAQGTNSNWSYPTWPSHLDHILITNELFNKFQNPNSEIKVIRIDDYMNSWNEYENNISDHRPVGLKLVVEEALQISETINQPVKEEILIDILGREVNKNSNGIKFKISENGKVKKTLTNKKYK